VNRIFAEAVLEEADQGPAVVFIQDYHLALLPQMLRSRNPELIIGQVWHIPWPASDILRTYPWADELLDGMLSHDLLGFHSDSPRAHFLAALKQKENATIEPDGKVMCSGSRSTVLRSAPASIDFRRDPEQPCLADVDRMMESWRSRLSPASFVGVGIDRSDYTKGIPERLLAIRALLEQKPEWRGKLTFVQVAVPSRTNIPDYTELERTTHGLVEEMNSRWGTKNWKPVVLESRDLGAVEMMALHRLAHFCMVTPLHDGLNLAKEFVASRSDGDGVLILSRFAGSAAELHSALLVNPFSQSSLVASILQALGMTKTERQSRMSAARAAVSAHNIYSSAARMVEAFVEVIRGFEQTSPLPLRYEVSVA
jgi:trehalose 6-phosphate synthase